MNKYLLLRDNHQRGPFSLEELSALRLQPSDLVWIQGKSDGWTYAGEIDELAGLVEAPERTSEVQNFSTGLSSDSFTRESLSEPFRRSLRLETKFTRPLDEIKEMYVGHLQKNGTTKKYKGALLAAIAVILLLSAFLIKTIMDRKAVQVKVADVAINPPAKAVTNADNFQNALSKEFIPYEAKPKKAKPKDLKKMISVEQNDFHVRLLGGIKDLKLTVQNYSEHLLDKVEIRVDYLKPKGEIIDSEVVTVNGIKSQGSKTVDVPPSARGVKIKYTILSVESKEYKTVLEEI